MNNFCSNCGNQLNPNDTFCSNCGASRNSSQQPMNNFGNQKPLGNGVSTAGLVLGIIAAAFGLIALLTMSRPETKLELLLRLAQNNIEPSKAAGLGVGIGFSIYSWLPAVIGLPLSISGFNKSKTGKSKAGIILNASALVASVIVIVYFVSIF